MVQPTRHAHQGQLSQTSCSLATQEDDSCARIASCEMSMTEAEGTVSQLNEAMLKAIIDGVATKAPKGRQIDQWWR